MFDIEVRLTDDAEIITLVSNEGETEEELEESIENWCDDGLWVGDYPSKGESTYIPACRIHSVVYWEV